MTGWEEAIAIKARSMTDDELLRTLRNTETLVKGLGAGPRSQGAMMARLLRAEMQRRLLARKPLIARVEEVK